MPHAFIDAQKIPPVPPCLIKSLPPVPKFKKMKRSGTIKNKLPEKLSMKKVATEK